MAAVRDYIYLARPKQWTKNLFVFGAILFSRSLFDLASVLTALLAFLSFCLASSSVYVFNDIVDADKDRIHPKKRNRPIARGAIKPSHAIVYGAILFVCSGVFAWFLRADVLLIVLVYCGANAAYSAKLKHVVLVDVLIIALGFVFRVLAGSLAIRLEPSPWFLLCTFLLALFLALCKRRAELLALGGDATAHRKILEDYSDDKLVDQLIVIVSATTIMAYSLYSIDSPFGQSMMITIPFVIYAMFRYMFLVYKRERGGEPANILLGDRPFMAGCLLWVFAVVIVIYVMPLLGGGGR